MKITIKVEGMTCGGCKAAVEGALRRVPGVASADVSLEAAQAVVDYDEKKTAPSELRAAIEKAGFKAG
jgi:copper chaperone